MHLFLKYSFICIKNFSVYSLLKKLSTFFTLIELYTLKKKKKNEIILKIMTKMVVEKIRWTYLSLVLTPRHWWRLVVIHNNIRYINILLAVPRLRHLTPGANENVAPLDSVIEWSYRVSRGVNSVGLSFFSGN